MTENDKTTTPQRTRPTIKQILAEQEGKKAALTQVRKRTQRILEVLSREEEPLFALLDTARDSRILPLLKSGDCEFRILYTGKTAQTLAEHAPYLVQLTREEPLLEKLIEKGWGQSWGYYFFCGDDVAKVLQRFRRLTVVKMPDGKIVFFRFYDPRVLRAYLPTAQPDELEHFFGAGSAFYLEAENENEMLSYRLAKEANQENRLIRTGTPLI